MSENLASSIQQLILLGKGDRGRLEYILEMITMGKPLPISDQRYLEGIIPLYLGSQDSESLQRHTELAINSLYSEMRTLQEKLDRLERHGFERYVGRKAVFFFVTVFVGWHAFQEQITEALVQYVPASMIQYMFPLNTLANSFGQGSLVELAFLSMALAWPFIGAVHLSRFIRSRKSQRSK
ncbi:MAG TPA: hypothetical protein VJ792_08910 [Candidatus Nitrosotalea sp.]|nr:hypothetical protein [Candidatus Nitrosotalea sp.]